MSNKSHIYFRNPQEGEAPYKQKTRYPGAQEESDDDYLNYTPKRDDFINSLKNFFEGKKIREKNRNISLKVPATVDYIIIHFHDFFDSSFFDNRYRNNFGLSPILFTEFNTVGLFGIVDSEKFNYFIQQLEKFINTTDHNNPKYHTDIKYIKEFTFYSSEQIIHYQKFQKHVIISIVDSVELFQNFINPVEESLIQYLKDRRVEFIQDYNTNKIELFNVTEDIVKEIADNFDIIQSINSYAAGLVKPSIYNLPDKSYGFTITNVPEELPIIGIIDTGVSSQTPLGGLLVNTDDSLNLTSSPINVDEANHGTSVAALAALGERLYPNHIGTFEADAKILSIKILREDKGIIPESEVIRLIRMAHMQYGVQIFNLSIGYIDYKKNNQEISEYAYALDKLCNELNILIFIATGNNDSLTYQEGIKNKPVIYPLHFDNELSNICSPAESMNNISIGAYASNFEDNDMLRISPVGSVPAIYTRKCHINWHHPSMLSSTNKINWHRANKKLFKPDICNNAGDYDRTLDPSTTGLKILSALNGIFFNRDVGTSFSSPLTANLAAKLLRVYPNLRHNMQTVKALIINSSNNDGIDTALSGLNNVQPNAIAGHGLPDVEKCLFSNENRVTLILEDVITADQIKGYPINIPKYLLDSQITNALLKVNATLCFKFEPLKNQHLAYCPIHIAFGVFKNVPLNAYLKSGNGEIIRNERNLPISVGINDNKTSHFVFHKSWSQDYYYKPKMLSNVQKISFNISKKVLIEQDNILKIAVNAKLHKVLNDLDRRNYLNKHISFSIVFTIEETPVKNTNSNRLYNELTAINNLEAINVIEAELEVYNQII